MVKYEAEVYTGSKRGAGTDANVFLNVFGLLGDTGDRALLKSSANRNKFERGNVSVHQQHEPSVVEGLLWVHD